MISGELMFHVEHFISLRPIVTLNYYDDIWDALISIIDNRFVQH